MPTGFFARVWERACGECGCTWRFRICAKCGVGNFSQRPVRRGEIVVGQVPRP